MPLVLIPGLLAAGIGSLVSIGMGAWTGLSTSDISLSPLPLPPFGDPIWSISSGRSRSRPRSPWRLSSSFASPESPSASRRRVRFFLPVVGLLVAGLGIAFSQTTDQGVDQVLFSGQDAIGPLVATGSLVSFGARTADRFKGLAYGFSLGTFRGGPTFPAMFLGAAAGLMAAQLPGFEMTPAVAIGLGAAVVSVLRLPLAAVVLATLLTSAPARGRGP